MLNTEKILEMQTAYEAGFKKALEFMGVVSPYISEREAYSLYGVGTVRRWVKEGLIKPLKDGARTSKKRYNREQLSIIASCSNRTSYFKDNDP